MIDLLTKIFVKNKDNVKDPVVRRAYGTLASVVGILLNVLLAAAKLLAGTLSGSISIRADAINNLSDAGSSVISLFSFKLSAKPADRDHPFGHARMEYVASMIVSFLILFIGVELIRGAIDKLISPVPIDFNLIAVIILGASVLVKLWLAYFNRTVGKRIDSDVMRATAVDSLSDAGATAAVLIATLVSRLLPAHVSPYIDPVMGLIVAALIFWAGLRVLNDTKNSILGEAPTKEIVEQIQQVVSEFPEALGIHDLAVHNYGPGRAVASLHVEVDGKRDIFLTHDTIDLIERRLQQELGIDCTIHLDPIVTDDERVTEWRARIAALVKQIHPDIAIHDFRMVPGTTHTNYIFDAVLPIDMIISDEEAQKMISTAVSQHFPGCFGVVNIDRSYI